MTAGTEIQPRCMRTAQGKNTCTMTGTSASQMDEAGGLYFAQARRYDSGIGRLVSEDIMRGHIAVPFTMNHYSYCWNRPMDLVDLNECDQKIQRQE